MSAAADSLSAADLRALLPPGAALRLSLHAGSFRGVVERDGRPLTPECECARLDTLARTLALAVHAPEQGSSR